MDFVSDDGPAVLVPHSSDGQRLQRFASHAFREELGRGGGHLHGACKNAAHQGTFLVNGVQHPGRHVLSAGDVVTLAKHGTLAETNGSASRARMDYAAQAEPEAVRLTGPFAAYYTLQRLCEPDEWARVEAASAWPLPLSLRPNGSVPSHVHAVATLRGLMPERLRPVPWLASAVWAAPGGGDEDGAPAARERATQLLLEAQSCGELALQEAAAMLPALALAPRASDAVLDLCAAPGGKTLQLLDAMMADARAEAQARAGGVAAGGVEEAGGVLVSNDVQRERQERTLRRAWSQPSAPLLVTCADATTFALPGSHGGPSGSSCASSGSCCGPSSSSGHASCGGASSAPTFFDRVLCDVPCSGDGTLRKSPDVLGRWSVRSGLRAHVLQLRILRRGLALLRPGGRLAYSTCSLDPLQNEAVVHAALRAEPAARLLALAEALPPAARAAVAGRAGLRTWRVPHPRFGREGGEESYAAWGEVPEELRSGGATDAHEQRPSRPAAAEAVGEVKGAGPRQPQPQPQPQPQQEEEERLRPSMFAPAEGLDEATSAAMVRLLPSRSATRDCGGFFVAVFTRDAAPAPDAPPHASAAAATAAAPATAATPAAAPAAPTAEGAAPGEGAEVDGGAACVDAATRRELCDFFGLEGAAGAALLARLAVSARGATGAPLLVSTLTPAARRLLRGLLGTHTAGGATHGAVAAPPKPPAVPAPAPPSAPPPPPPVVLVGAGAPLLAAMPRSLAWWPAEAPWRVCQEGAAPLAAAAARRVLRATGIAAAVELLRRRRADAARLAELRASGALCGLEGCEEPTGALRPGAVVLALPVPPGTQPLAVAGLLDGRGLALLASDDVLARYADLVSH